MAKSDSTPCLPKVWVYLRHGKVMAAAISKSRPLPDETVHQYAPVQKPRRCVVKVVTFDGKNSTECGLFPPGFDFCPYCGGRIVRRKS